MKPGTAGPDTLAYATVCHDSFDSEPLTALDIRVQTSKMFGLDLPDVVKPPRRRYATNGSICIAQVAQSTRGANMGYQCADMDNWHEHGRLTSKTHPLMATYLTRGPRIRRCCPLM